MMMMTTARSWRRRGEGGEWQERKKRTNERSRVGIPPRANDVAPEKTELAAWVKARCAFSYTNVAAVRAEGRFK